MRGRSRPTWPSTGRVASLKSDSTTSMPITAARDDLSEVINRVAYSKERICLTRHGEPLLFFSPNSV